MTSKSDLVRELASRKSMTQAQAKDAVEGVVSLVVENLRSGGPVRIDGLGVFSVKARGERMGRNPRTGEAVRIGPSRRVAFKPATSLKGAI